MVLLKGPTSQIWYLSTVAITDLLTTCIQKVEKKVNKKPKFNALMCSLKDSVHFVGMAEVIKG